MFTVCPKCALTLVVTAGDLRVAQGYVRCGRCSNVFNALARLSEDRNAAAAAASGSTPEPGTAPRPAQSNASPASTAPPAQQSPAQPARIPQATASYTYTRPPESTPPTGRPQQASAAPPRPAQQPTSQSSASPPPPSGSLPVDLEDDEAIPEDALEFNPAEADVNQVFVEAPPNPEWTAATGTFKAIVLQNEAAAPNTGANEGQTSVRAHAPEHSSSDEEEIELDADFLSATAQMRKLKLGLSEGHDASAHVPPAPRAKDGAPGLPESGEAHSRAPHPSVEPPSRTHTYTPVEPPPRAQTHSPAPVQPAVSPSPRAQPHAPNETISHPAPRPDQQRTRPSVSDAPPPRVTERSAGARAAANTPSQAKPRSDDPSSFPEPDVIARVPPRKTVKAFGLDSVEPPPEQLASLARSRIAPAGFELEPPSRVNRSPTLWMAGTGVLLIVLLAQIVNHYRNDLAATAQFNKPITALYSALGVHLTPRWDLHAYDVRQLGASVDAESAGQIMVRASIKNSGHQAQPMPLLRVTLQDRFGNRIAARDVPPGNYLPHAIPATAFLSAGQRIDAEMAFVDPGANAVGFEIDACLPAPAGGIACANDPVSR